MRFKKYLMEFVDDRPERGENDPDYRRLIQIIGAMKDGKFGMPEIQEAVMLASRLGVLRHSFEQFYRLWIPKAVT